MDKIPYIFPARVHQRANPETLLALVKDRHAFDPVIFAERDPFFFAAEISSNRVDAYFTRMHKSTLANFAADATAGVSLQDSHMTHRLGVGRSLRGILEEVDNEITRVVADFYIVPGINLGTNSDDVIAGIRSGIISDVSVGFHGGEFRCSICGRDLWDFECRHIPGLQYEKREGDVVLGTELAVAWIHDARLAEVSTVYEGATPGAGILKARQEAEAGRILPEQARVLEAHYRIKLPGALHVFPGSSQSINLTQYVKTETVQGTAQDLSQIIKTVEMARATQTQAPKEKQRMKDKTKGPEVVSIPVRYSAELDVDLRSLIVDSEPGDLGPETTLADVVEAVGTLESGQARAVIAAGIRSALVRVKALEGEVVSLSPKAKDGERFRERLIQETVEEGIRAQGADFPAEVVKTMLATQEISAIETMLEHYRKIAAGIFTGGRRTVDTTPKDPDTEEEEEEDLDLGDPLTLPVVSEQY